MASSIPIDDYPPVSLTVTATPGVTWGAADVATVTAIPNVVTVSLDPTSTVLVALSGQHEAQGVAAAMAQAFPGYGVVWATSLPP